MEQGQLTKNRILVDTDVFSYIFKKDPRGDFFKPYIINQTAAISFMSVAQLYYGAYKNDWGQRKITQLENALKNYVILPYDYMVCQLWARIRADTEAIGLMTPPLDAWIAACALRHDCALATNNQRHFRNIKSLTVICPSFDQLIP